MGVRFRSAIYCIVWLTFALLSIATWSLCVLVKDDLDTASLFIGLFAIYCVQCLFVEALGVKISQEGLSIPRRLLLDFPFLVLWRESIPSNDIDRIASLRMDRIRVYRRSSGRPEFALFNHDQKSQFFRFVKQMFPLAQIFRDS
jgi:hypothetical protein